MIMLLRLASLFHDIGKFYQRTGIDIDLNKYKKYLVYRNNKYQYYHGAYTAMFLENFLDRHFLGFLELSASHHLPKTSLVKKADIISAAHDRRDSDYDDIFGEGEISNSNLITTRLLSIFNEIKINKHKNQKKYIKLEKFADFWRFEENINFNYQKSKDDYQKLFNEMIKEINKLGYNKYELLYHQIYPILKNYTITIPANTYNTSFPTIGLFDHLKLTTAISNSLSRTNLSKEFVIIKYHLHGITDFVYQNDDFKLVQARSLYMNLLSELIAYRIISEFGLSYENILYSLGGQGRILVPNVINIEERIKRINCVICANVKFKHQRIIKFVLSYDIYDDEELKAGIFKKNISLNEKIVINSDEKFSDSNQEIDYQVLNPFIKLEKFIIAFDFKKQLNGELEIDFNDLGKLVINPSSLESDPYYLSINQLKLGESKYIGFVRALKSQEALVMVMMDIKDLHLILKTCIAKKAQSISKDLTISRLLELFFAKTVTNICKKNGNVNLLYAGGDDIVFITDENNAKQLIYEITSEFQNYTGEMASRLISGMIPINHQPLLKTYHDLKMKLKNIQI
jgi:CRISPR/Cas system-associated protein Cas10 (large subunit of type III CRISPR-Cas system)